MSGRAKKPAGLRAGDVELEKVVSLPRNPKRHDVGAIAGSMSRWLFAQRLVINERTGHLLSGHGRVKALAELKARGGAPPAGIEIRGAAWIVPADYIDVPAKDEEALALALNKLQDRGGYDAKELHDVLQDLSPELVELAGFDRDVLEFEEPEPTAPAERKRAGVKAAQMWRLGDHLLLCGDAQDPANYERLMGDDKAALIFTDPPYGVDYVAPSGKHAKILNDHRTGDALLKLLTGAFRLLERHAMPTAAFYIWHASTTREEFTTAMKMAGLEEIQYLIWAKPSFVLGHADYHWAHEPCLYAAKAGRSPAFYGGRDQGTVWRVDHVGGGGMAAVVGSGITIADGEGNTIFLAARSPRRRRQRAFRLEEGKPLRIFAGEAQGTVWEVTRDAHAEHPNQKPIELARRAIENSSREGEIVLDVFAGSGSTLLAAQATGRRARAMELDPAHCDTAIARWETVTGRQAERIDEPTPRRKRA